MRRKAWALLMTGALVVACSGKAAVLEDGTADGGGGDSGASDGAIGDAGKRSAPCTGASVQFELAVSGDYCQGSMACDVTWLTITRADGTPVTTSNYCMSDCDQCVLVGCPANCPAPTRVPAEGLKSTWNGTYFAASKCGAEQIGCMYAQCAAPGGYVAHMCVYRATSDAGAGPGVCQGAPTPTCVDVPFTWPTAGPVRGSIK